MSTRCPICSDYSVRTAQKLNSHRGEASSLRIFVVQCIDVFYLFSCDKINVFSQRTGACVGV